MQTWRALIEAQEAGKTRSIGVSNFQPAHLDRIVEETGVVPVVNQVEVHPFFANEDVRAANREARRAHRGVVADRQGHGRRRRHDRRDRLARRAVRRRRSTLRWHVQRGDIVFPKSMNADRMRQNFEIFDFELEPAAPGRAIDELDRGEDGRTGPNPDTFDWIP